MGYPMKQCTSSKQKKPCKLLNVFWWKQSAGNIHISKNEIYNSYPPTQKKPKSLSGPISFEIILYIYILYTHFKMNMSASEFGFRVFIFLTSTHVSYQTP